MDIVIQTNAPEPVYEQIVRQIHEAVKAGTLTRASQAPDGTEGNKPSARNDVAINGDGQTMVLQSYADNLVEGDAFDQREVFVWHAPAPQ